MTKLIYRLDLAHWNAPLIVTPLIGLGYIIVLPFVGLVTLVSLSVYRGKLALASLRHRAKHEITFG